jgi:hypothetical protein
MKRLPYIALSACAAAGLIVFAIGACAPDPIVDPPAQQIDTPIASAPDEVSAVTWDEGTLECGLDAGVAEDWNPETGSWAYCEPALAGQPTKPLDPGGVIDPASVAAALATPCATEDSDNSFWDAATMGNQMGASYVTIEGHVFPYSF